MHEERERSDGKLLAATQVVKGPYRARNRRPASLPKEWDPADPNDAMVDVEERRWLERPLADLPQRDPEVALPRFGERCEIEAMAWPLHRTRNDVDQASCRMRSRIRARLDG